MQNVQPVEEEKSHLRDHEWEHPKSHGVSTFDISDAKIKEIMEEALGNLKDEEEGSKLTKEMLPNMLKRYIALFDITLETVNVNHFTNEFVKPKLEPFSSDKNNNNNGRYPYINVFSYFCDLASKKYSEKQVWKMIEDYILKSKFNTYDDMPMWYIDRMISEFENKFEDNNSNNNNSNNNNVNDKYKNIMDLDDSMEPNSEQLVPISIRASATIDEVFARLDKLGLNGDNKFGTEWWPWQCLSKMKLVRLIGCIFCSFGLSFCMTRDGEDSDCDLRLFGSGKELAIVRVIADEAPTDDELVRQVIGVAVLNESSRVIVFGMNGFTEEAIKTATCYNKNPRLQVKLLNKGSLARIFKDGDFGNQVKQLFDSLNQAHHGYSKYSQCNDK